MRNTSKKMKTQNNISIWILSLALVGLMVSCSSVNNLPEDDDWDSLGQLGFELGNFGIRPDYTKLNEDEFELVYPDGFDGPYLMFNSKSGQWKLDFPTPK